MKRKSANWLKIARYDLRAAELAFGVGLHLTCVEKCHSSLEKLLKGLIVEQDKEPARIHDLLRLISKVVVENLQNDIYKTLDDLNGLFMLTRYPDDIELMEDMLNEAYVQHILSETKRIFRWLEKKLPMN
jgi:HEPN domain-containing protein